MIVERFGTPAARQHTECQQQHHPGDAVLHEQRPDEHSSPDQDETGEHRNGNAREADEYRQPREHADSDVHETYVLVVEGSFGIVGEAWCEASVEGGRFVEPVGLVVDIDRHVLQLGQVLSPMVRAEQQFATGRQTRADVRLGAAPVTAVGRGQGCCKSSAHVSLPSLPWEPAHHGGVRFVVPLHQ